MDVMNYIESVEKWSKHPGFDFAIITGPIEGDMQHDQELLDFWTVTTVKGVPVWHPHESLRWLKYLCTRYERVAVGGSPKYPFPGNIEWWNRITQAMNEIRTNLAGLRVKLLSQSGKEWTEIPKLKTPAED
jgi:hypothetical protein